MSKLWVSPSCCIGHPTYHVLHWVEKDITNHRRGLWQCLCEDQMKHSRALARSPYLRDSCMWLWLWVTTVWQGWDLTTAWTEAPETMLFTLLKSMSSSWGKNHYTLYYPEQNHWTAHRSGWRAGGRVMLWQGEGTWERIGEGKRRGEMT